MLISLIMWFLCGLLRDQPGEKYKNTYFFGNSKAGGGHWAVQRGRTMAQWGGRGAGRGRSPACFGKVEFHHRDLPHGIAPRPPSHPNQTGKVSTIKSDLPQKSPGPSPALSVYSVKGRFCYNSTIASYSVTSVTVLEYGADA